MVSRATGGATGDGKASRVAVMTQPMACARRRRQARAVERFGSEEAAERPKSRSLGLDATAATSGSSLGQKLVDEA